MLIEPELLGTGARILTSVASGAALALAAISAPWRAWLGDRELQWVWLLSLGLLVGVWSMKAGITPGFSLRFLMVTALTLMHGWPLAVIGCAMVLAVLCVVGQASWASFGADLLCVAVVPALFSAWLHEHVHARLPHNYFIYFFVPCSWVPRSPTTSPASCAWESSPPPARWMKPTSGPSTSPSCRS